MDLTLIKKFRTGLFALALVSMTACSSGQVDDTGAPVESADAAATDAAKTDAAPAAEDASLDGPTQVAPDGAAPAAPAAPADAAMAKAQEPANLDTTPVADAGTVPPPAPVADAATPPASPLADAPPSSNSATEMPVDAKTVSDPAPVADSSTSIADVTTEENSAAKQKTSAASGDGMHYEVRKGDTLMKIAFENYGDLYRWREIYEANRDKIQDPNHVPPGTELTLNGAGMVTIERNGEQYLIKHGDTLGSISNEVYGTTRKWKKLWENNRQLIKDPNKIYAGFYLYYQPGGKLTHDNGSGDLDGAGAQNMPAQPAAQEVVQQAKAPQQQVAAQSATGNESRAPASTAPAAPAAGQATGH